MTSKDDNPKQWWWQVQLVSWSRVAKCKLCNTSYMSAVWQTIAVMICDISEKRKAQGHQLMGRGSESGAFVSCKMLGHNTRRALVASKTRCVPCSRLRFLLSSTSDALVSIRGFRAFAHSSWWVAAGIFFDPGLCINFLQSAIQSMTVCSFSRFWAMASGNPLHGTQRWALP